MKISTLLEKLAQHHDDYFNIIKRFHDKIELSVQERFIRENFFEQGWNSCIDCIRQLDDIENGIMRFPILHNKQNDNITTALKNVNKTEKDYLTADKIYLNASNERRAEAERALDNADKEHSQAWSVYFSLRAINKKGETK